MKTGHVILILAGVGVVATAVAYMRYRPKATVTYNVSSKSGTIQLGSSSAPFTSTSAKELSSWNGWRFSIEGTDSGGLGYVLTRGTTTYTRSDLGPNTPSNSYVTVNIS